jgi:hypothetical protein
MHPFCIAYARTLNANNINHNAQAIFAYKYKINETLQNLPIIHSTYRKRAGSRIRCQKADFWDRDKPTKSNRTVVVAWHGEPMRDPGLVQAKKPSFEGRG